MAQIGKQSPAVCAKIRTFMYQTTAIEQALRLIEEHLQAPLPPALLAQSVGMSRWYFQRTFSAMVGEPVSTYLRRRRLHAAAEELRQTRRRILDVALDFQFESQPAFTRAFRAEVGQPPGQWRRHSPTRLVGCPPLELNFASIKKRYLTMNLIPEIVTLPPRTFAGLETRFTSALSPESNNMDVIPRLWGTFFPRMGELPALVPGHAFGLSDCPEQRELTDLGPEELLYLAAVEVPKAYAPKPPFTVWCTPGGTYARFTHRGPIEAFSATMGFIYGRWLPESGHQRGPGPDIEHYDERFCPENSAKSELDVYVPLALAAKP